jgi:hypothetical protein
MAVADIPNGQYTLQVGVAYIATTEDRCRGREGAVWPLGSGGLERLAVHESTPL